MQRTVLGDIGNKQIQKQHGFRLKELNIVNNRNNYVMRENTRCHERMKQEGLLRKKKYWAVLKYVSGSREEYEESSLQVDLEVWMGLQQVYNTGRTIARKSYQASGSV